MESELRVRFRPDALGTGLAALRGGPRRAEASRLRPSLAEPQVDMPQVWIIHRDPMRRVALARLAAAGSSAVIAGPGDPQLAEAPIPEVVLLGLEDDVEAELQFAHRQSERLPGARWVLLAQPGDSERVRRLFDSVDRVVMPYPPDARCLRQALNAGASRRLGEPLPLSERPARDQLSERFARWFADIEMPELLRILDPRLVDVPVLLCGEPGSGRSLLARYLHRFGGTATGTLFRLICRPESGPEDLLRQLAEQGRRATVAPATACVWLDAVDRLPDACQHQLAGWVEYGSPPVAAAAGRPRWIGTARGGDEGLADDLRRALGTFCIRIPPLRERVELIAPFVTETAQSWCASRGERPRRFGEDAIAVLEEYPWPGNLAELEATVVQTLLTSSGSPIGADDLQHDDVAMAPLDAESVGVRLVEPAEPRTVSEERTLKRIPVVREAELPPEEVLLETIAVEESGLRRLVAAVAHEVRNPLTTIRNFSELLPRNYRDAEFRAHFAELVENSVDRIETVVDQLAGIAAQETPGSQSVDLTQLLEELLSEHRSAIRRRRLVVLKEFERHRPDALGDPVQLRTSFGALLRKCLDLAPERGDLYLASRHHASGLRGKPSIRILVRFSGPQQRAGGGAAPVPGLSPAENSLEFATVEAVARAHGGALAIQAGEGDETVIVVDLPAPR